MTAASPTLQVDPWRLFDVEVAEVSRLSPSFVRVRFGASELEQFADNGYDQRVKLVLPPPEGGMPEFGPRRDWHRRLRELPENRRPAVRTYTVRQARPGVGEVDVDFALHEESEGCGPAARWVRETRRGDRVALMGPNALHEGPHGGIDFCPPSEVGQLLLAADETALPAVAAIAERLPLHARGEVLIEVPESGDRLPLRVPPQMRVTWLPREGGERGVALVPAVKQAAQRLLPRRTRGPALEDVDVDATLLWESPLAKTRCPDGVYAWLAGEAGVIKTLRRHLVSERGMARTAVAFMGYWRQGRAES